MRDQITIYEVGPRDGLQNEKTMIATKDKIKLVKFISADLGYERGIDCESTLVPVTNYLLERGFELINVSHGRICALYKNKNL